MPEARFGFTDVPGGASGSQLLASHGPTLLVNIGFDPDYRGKQPSSNIPAAGIANIQALIDTGAGESCIDSLLAAQLNLPIVDRRIFGGIGGRQEVNMHLAQIYVPALRFVIYGAFAGVHLSAGGQPHRALIGRTFLQHYTMVYDGRAGGVILSSPDPIPPISPPAASS